MAELYDSVYLPEYPDGAPPAEDVEWQTKDIDRPSMTTYRITADGRLSKEQWHLEPIPEEDRPYPDKCPALGMYDRVQDGWSEQEEYHGRFSFYAGFDAVDGLVTYEATFTHGQLEGFQRVY